MRNLTLLGIFFLFFIIPCYANIPEENTTTEIILINNPEEPAGDTAIEKQDNISNTTDIQVHEPKRSFFGTIMGWFVDGQNERSNKSFSEFLAWMFLTEKQEQPIEKIEENNTSIHEVEAPSH